MNYSDSNPSLNSWEINENNSKLKSIFLDNEQSLEKIKPKMKKENIKTRITLNINREPSIDLNYSPSLQNEDIKEGKKNARNLK